MGASPTPMTERWGFGNHKVRRATDLSLDCKNKKITLSY